MNNTNTTTNTTRPALPTTVCFMDAHSRPARPGHADGVIKYTRLSGKTFYCPLYVGKVFCLNKFTLCREGVGLRLSPMSVGPTLRPEQVRELLSTGSIDVPVGGKVELASAPEALEYLWAAKAVNKVLRQVEDEFDIDLHAYKR